MFTNLFTTFISKTCKTSSQHVRIARPEGLPGEWYAVRGKSTAKKGRVNCSQSDCPNICHPQCLGDDSQFTGTELQRLSQVIGIPDKICVNTDDDANDNILNFFVTLFLRQLPVLHVPKRSTHTSLHSSSTSSDQSILPSFSQMMRVCESDCTPPRRSSLTNQY